MISRSDGGKHRFSISDFDSIDFDLLLGLDSISIYNINTDGYNYYKTDDNNNFLNQAFKIVKKLRNMKYSGNIIVECDSLYDISQSLFNYQSLNTCFTTTLYSMEAVNDFVNCYIYNLDDCSTDNMSSRDKIVRMLFHQIKELYTYIEESRDFRKDVKDSLYDYIHSSFIYDLGKIMGMNFIKYSSEDAYILYYFENNCRDVKKYYPSEMLGKVLEFLDNEKGFLDYEGEDELLKDAIGRAYDQIVGNNELEENEFETRFDDYLKCNNLEDLKELIDSDDFDGMKLEYAYLLNILMDLDFESYKEYEKIDLSSCNIKQLEEGIYEIFSMILLKKNELTKRKITMSVHN